MAVQKGPREKTSKKHTSNVQSGNVLRILEFETKLLNIVAHRLNGRQLQIHPSLISADKDTAALLGKSLFRSLCLPEVETACSCKSDGTEERRFRRRLLGRFGRVLSHALWTQQSATGALTKRVRSRKLGNATYLANGPGNPEYTLGKHFQWQC